MASIEAFTVIPVCQWWNALNCPSATESVVRLGALRDGWLFLGIGLAALLQIGALYTPIGNPLLHLAPLSFAVPAEIVVVASAVLWAEEIRKLLARRSRRRRAPFAISGQPPLAAAHGGG